MRVFLGVSTWNYPSASEYPLDWRWLQKLKPWDWVKNPSTALTSDTLQPRFYCECKDNHLSTGAVAKCIITESWVSVSLGNQTNEESSFQSFFRVIMPTIEEMVKSSRFSKWKLWLGWLSNTVFCAMLSCHWTLCHHIPFMKFPETKLEIQMEWTSSHLSPSQQHSWFSCFCQWHHCPNYPGPGTPFPEESSFIVPSKYGWVFSLPQASPWYRRTTPNDRMHPNSSFCHHKGNTVPSYLFTYVGWVPC